MRGHTSEGLPILIWQKGDEGPEFVFPSLIVGLGRDSVRKFNRGSEPDPKLSKIQRERFLAWLRLHSILNGTAATIDDTRTAWGEAWIAWRDLLPAGAELADVMNIRKLPELIGQMADRQPRRKIRVPADKFIKRLSEENWSTEARERAYEYLTATILRLTRLVQWHGALAILCKPDEVHTALEVAHYASALLGESKIKTCIWCNKTFVPAKRSHAQFCSQRCGWAKRKANQRAKGA